MTKASRSQPQLDIDVGLHWIAQGNLSKLKHAMKTGGLIVNQAHQIPRLDKCWGLAGQASSWTPLLLACAVGTRSFVELLLKAGANSNVSHPSGLTCLVALVLNGSTSLAEKLATGKMLQRAGFSRFGASCQVHGDCTTATTCAMQQAAIEMGCSSAVGGVGSAGASAIAPSVDVNSREAAIAPELVEWLLSEGDLPDSHIHTGAFQHLSYVLAMSHQLLPTWLDLLDRHTVYKRGSPALGELFCATMNAAEQFRRAAASPSSAGAGLSALASPGPGSGGGTSAGGSGPDLSAGSSLAPALGAPRSKRSATNGSSGGSGDLTSLEGGTSPAAGAGSAGSGGKGTALPLMNDVATLRAFLQWGIPANGPLYPGGPAAVQRLMERPHLLPVLLEGGMRPDLLIGLAPFRLSILHTYALMGRNCPNCQFAVQGAKALLAAAPHMLHFKCANVTSFQVALHHSNLALAQYLASRLGPQEQAQYGRVHTRLLGRLAGSKLKGGMAMGLCSMSPSPKGAFAAKGSALSTGDDAGHELGLGLGLGLGSGTGPEGMGDLLGLDSMSQGIKDMLSPEAGNTPAEAGNPAQAYAALHSALQQPDGIGTDADLTHLLRHLPNMEIRQAMSLLPLLESRNLFNVISFVDHFRAIGTKVQQVLQLGPQGGSLLPTLLSPAVTAAAVRFVLSHPDNIWFIAVLRQLPPVASAVLTRPECCAVLAAAPRALLDSAEEVNELPSEVSVDATESVRIAALASDAYFSPSSTPLIGDDVYLYGGDGGVGGSTVAREERARGLGAAKGFSLEGQLRAYHAAGYTRLLLGLIVAVPQCIKAAWNDLQIMACVPEACQEICGELLRCPKLQYLLLDALDTTLHYLSLATRHLTQGRKDANAASSTDAATDSGDGCAGTSSSAAHSSANPAAAAAAALSEMTESRLQESARLVFGEAYDSQPLQPHHMAGQWSCDEALPALVHHLAREAQAVLDKPPGDSIAGIPFSPTPTPTSTPTCSQPGATPSSSSPPAAAAAADAGPGPTHALQLSNGNSSSSTLCSDDAVTLASRGSIGLSGSSSPRSSSSSSSSPLHHSPADSPPRSASPAPAHPQPALHPVTAAAAEAAAPLDPLDAEQAAALDELSRLEDLVNNQVELAQSLSALRALASITMDALHPAQALARVGAAYRSTLASIGPTAPSPAPVGSAGTYFTPLFTRTRARTPDSDEEQQQLAAEHFAALECYREAAKQLVAVQRIRQEAAAAAPAPASEQAEAMAMQAQARSIIGHPVLGRILRRLGEMGNVPPALDEHKVQWEAEARVQYIASVLITKQLMAAV